MDSEHPEQEFYRLLCDTRNHARDFNIDMALRKLDDARKYTDTTQDGCAQVSNTESTIYRLAAYHCLDLATRYTNDVPSLAKAWADEALKYGRMVKKPQEKIPV